MCPAELPRPSSRSVVLRSTFESCSAGKAPKMIPVRSEIASVNRSTRRSMLMGMPCGIWPAAQVTSARVAIQLSPTPSMPATSASSTLSISSCRTISPRLAPSAVRTAISLLRARARESSRLVTLAHAISRTRATAPDKTRTLPRTSATRSSRSGPMLMVRAASGAAGFCSLYCWLRMSISACAWAGVVSGRNRAT